MAQNVTIMGASYSDVPAVTLPKTGGGTAKFTDVSPTDAVESDVASGKIFFKADGSQATGTASGGGGTTEEPVRDVNFIDYDGKIVYSYSAADFQQLSAMPSNPSHAGLTAQGWNWSLSDAKTEVASNGTLWIGQMYITQSGNTEIDVNFESAARLSPILTVSVNGTITVDWGDNTTPDTVSGTSLYDGLDVSHTYAAPGEYTIAIHVVSGEYQFYGSNTRTLLRGPAPNYTGDGTRVYSNCIKAVRFGSGMSSIGDYALFRCYSLKTVTIPNSVGIISSYYAFSDCRNLKSLTIPSGVASVQPYMFRYCYALESVSLPKSVTSIESYAFDYCSALRMLPYHGGVATIDNHAYSNLFQIAIAKIQNGVSTIGGAAFANCYGLASSTFPSTVTSIGNIVFNGCYGLKEIHVLASSPPTIDSGTFSSIASDCIIYVPSASLAAYQSATNWSAYASMIQGE